MINTALAGKFLSAARNKVANRHDYDLPASEAYRLIEAAMVVLQVEPSGLTLEKLAASAFAGPISEIMKANPPQVETMPARDWTVAVNEFFNVEFLIDGKVELVMSSDDARLIAEAFTQAAKVAEGTHQ